MAERPDLFIVAGEPSGDRLGAALLAGLATTPGLTRAGIGGDAMRGQGLQTLFPMADLTVMGVSDVLVRLPRLLLRLGQIVRAIRQRQPRVVVLIDNKLFSTLVARRLRRAGYRGPILLYVAPTVWARKPERAAEIRPLFDEVLAILPFEPEIMARLGGPPTHYVGHPALARPQVPPDLATADAIALLPGSRPGELRRHLPLFAEIVAALPARGAFYIPTLPHLADTIARATADWPAPVAIVTDPVERRNREARTRLAIACAGTATLELALAGIPMVVTYVMDGVQARHFDRLGRPRVGLPNIVLGADITPECVLARPDPAPVIAAARHLLDDPEAGRTQQASFDHLRTLMDTGLPGVPREDPAQRVRAHLEREPDSMGRPPADR